MHYSSSYTGAIVLYRSKSSKTSKLSHKMTLWQLWHYGIMTIELQQRQSASHLNVVRRKWFNPSSNSAQGRIKTTPTIATHSHT